MGCGQSEEGNALVLPGGAALSRASTLLIDSMDDCDGKIEPVAGRGGVWFALNSNCEGLKGEQTPAAEPCDQGATTVPPADFPMEGTKGACHARTYGGGFPYQENAWGYASIGFELRLDGAAYDASAYGGLRFTVQGTPIRIKVATVETQAEGDHFGRNVTAGTHTITWAQLQQEGWGKPASFDPKKMTGIFFEAADPGKFDYTIDDVEFIEAGSAGGAPDAWSLLELTKSCKKISVGNFATDSGGAAKIPICGLAGAIFWRADLDIDCDGKPSDVCNKKVDPAFQAMTAALDSHGEYLDAAKVPYFVIPSPSIRFNYERYGIEYGSVAAVIYDGKVEYGVFADTGPEAIIGEASYAMAKLLGIDPNPEFGGAESGVTYIVFTGPAAVAQRTEDHREAVAIGTAQAKQLLKAK